MTLSELQDIRNDFKELTVVVTGGRYYSNKDLVYETLAKIKPTTVMAGCASGADKFALQCAMFAGIWLRMFKADWTQYGLAAGPKRNLAMLQAAKSKGPCVVVAFPGNKGTRNCIETAKQLKIPVIEIEDVQNEPEF